MRRSSNLVQRTLSLLRLHDSAKGCTNNGLPSSKNHCLVAPVISQYRFYTPEAPEINTEARQTECWNCKKTTSKIENMICDSCGHLQDVQGDVNFFELLKFPKNFIIEQSTLTKRFRQLQTLVHPDKFSNRTTREQTNSADWSSLINKAYKTLSMPVERGQYMLRLHGEDIPQDNSALNTVFLMEMMERNEEVEEAASNDDLDKLNAQIVQELDEKVNKLGNHFAAKDLTAAKAILVEMKYLLSIQKSIKEKMQRLMET